MNEFIYVQSNDMNCLFLLFFRTEKKRPIEHFSNISGGASAKEPRPLTRCYWEIRHGVGMNIMGQGISDWLVDFLSEQKGKVRENIDCVFIDSVLATTRDMKKRRERVAATSPTTNEWKFSDGVMKLANQYGMKPTALLNCFWTSIAAIYSNLIDVGVDRYQVMRHLELASDWASGTLGLALKISYPKTPESFNGFRVGSDWDCLSKTSYPF
jgi:hypothetical protein